MNLVETLLATVVFTASAAASLQLWGLAAVATARHDRLQDLVDRADAELMAVDLRLRRQARAEAAPLDCVAAAEQLVALALPASTDDAVSRQVALGGEGNAQVVVTVLVQELDQPRRRLYSPAAMNLCGGVPDEAETEGGEGDGEA